MRPKVRGNSGLRERYPIFFAFAGAPRLTAEEAIKADFDARIASVWRFLAAKVLKFTETLRYRERANYDPEDTLLAIYLELREKDDRWDHTRGSYITFANRIADHRLLEVREQARPVEGPRNAYTRSKEYAAMEARGTISPECRATAEAMRRVMGAQESWPAACDQEGGIRPDQEAEARESRARAKVAVVDALADLDPYEAVVLGKRFGLWGQTEQTAAEVATATRRTVAEVQVACNDACEAIRGRLRRLHGDSPL